MAIQPIGDVVVVLADRGRSDAPGMSVLSEPPGDLGRIVVKDAKEVISQTSRDGQDRAEQSIASAVGQDPGIQQHAWSQRVDAVFLRDLDLITSAQIAQAYELFVDCHGGDLVQAAADVNPTATELKLISG